MFKHLCLFTFFVTTAYQATADAPKCTLALSDTSAGMLDIGQKYSDNMALAQLVEIV